MKLPKIDIILIVDDVDIPTPKGIFADTNVWNSREWDDYDLLDMYNSGEISELRAISDFVTLNHMIQVKENYPEFEYEFTRKQKQILSEGYENYTEDIDEASEVPQLLEYISQCTSCTIPHVRRDPSLMHKNFAQYNQLRLAPEDYYSIVTQFEVTDFYGCIRSKYGDFLGDKIFQFLRNDEYFDSDGKSIGIHNLWMEINLRETYAGDIVALISLHDAKFDN